MHLNLDIKLIIFICSKMLEAVSIVCCWCIFIIIIAKQSSRCNAVVFSRERCQPAHRGACCCICTTTVARQPN